MVLISNSRPDDRHKMRKSKMTTELHPDVMIFDHSGIVRRKESMEQVAAVSWFRFEYPRLYESLIHVPNETQGTESYQQRLTEMGRVAGCSDLLFLLPTTEHPYAVFEMKTKKGFVDESKKKGEERTQTAFLNYHAERGAFCAVCRGNEAFQRAMKYYLQYI